MKPARLALILKMLEHLRRHYGARFFAMSATLPALVRSVLCETLGIEGQIAANSDLYTRFCRCRTFEGRRSSPGWNRAYCAVGAEWAVRARLLQHCAPGSGRQARIAEAVGGGNYR